MTYADLPAPRPNTPLPGGGTLLARQPCLLCRSCGTTYSADPGDYWDRTGEITCADCDDAPMVLADPLGDCCVPYGTAGEVHKMIGFLWDGA